MKSDSALEQVYNREMKKTSKSAWANPVKRPPQTETMDTPGNFEEFTKAMKRLIKAKPERKPTHASPGPVVSS